MYKIENALESSGTRSEFNGFCRNRWCGILALWVAVTPIIASAQLVSNLGEATGGFPSVGNSSNLDTWQATPFTTGANASGYTLTSATASWFGLVGSPANVVIGIYSDSSAEPGTLLETLSGANPSGIEELTYTSGGLALTAGTTYHIVANATGSPLNGLYRFASTVSNNETSSDAWTIGDSGLNSTDGGTSWSSGSSSLKFSIQATPVPEPHEYAMVVGLSLVGLVVVRRRYPSSQVA